MKNEERDERDAMLDRALAAYASQEPPAGLEARVLARVRAADVRRKPALPRWVFAVAAAAAGILLFALAPRVHYTDSGKQRRPQAVAHEVGQAGPEGAPTGNSADLQAGRWAQRAPRLPHSLDRAAVLSRVERRTAPALPRLEQFPARRPLSREERALLAFVREAPDEARKLAADQEQETPEPIRIEPIEIEPLHIAGLSEEK